MLYFIVFLFYVSAITLMVHIIFHKQLECPPLYDTLQRSTDVARI